MTALIHVHYKAEHVKYALNIIIYVLPNYTSAHHVYSPNNIINKHTHIHTHTHRHNDQQRIVTGRCRRRKTFSHHLLALVASHGRSAYSDVIRLPCDAVRAGAVKAGRATIGAVCVPVGRLVFHHDAGQLGQGQTVLNR